MLRRAQETAGAFLVAALCKVPEEDGRREVLATLTVALAEIEGPPDPERFTIEDSDTTVRADVEVTRLSDKVTTDSPPELSRRSIPEASRFRCSPSSTSSSPAMER